MKILFYLFLCFFVSVISNFAQNEKSAVVVAVPAGTEVEVTPAAVIISREVFDGQVVSFEVAEDIKINDKIVIARKTPVNATVIHSKEGGSFGSAGRLTIKFDSIETIDGQTIRLRGTERAKGKSKKKSWALISLGSLGAMTAAEFRGEDARFIPGEIFKAVMDEPKTITVMN